MAAKFVENFIFLRGIGERNDVQNLKFSFIYVTISAWFEKAYILDAYLAQIKWYVSVYMPTHYLSKYFNSENEFFIEFTFLVYQTGVFQRLGLF